MNGWRLRAGADFRVREWPGEATVVVYDPESGDTHLLSREALACLEAVGKGEPLGDEAGAMLNDLCHYRLIEPLP